MIAVMLRELGSYFRTPVGYIFTGLFLFVAGFFFTVGNLLADSSYYASFLQSILFLYLFAVPLLTMRLLSEERRRRTDQLLLTCPITVTAIVLGKFFAAFVVFLLTLSVTVSYAVVIHVFGDLEVGRTVGAYLGFVLLGAAFIAVGVLVSAASTSQIGAAILTFFVLLLIWFLNLVRMVVPTDALSGTLFAGGIAIAVALFVRAHTRNPIIAAATLAGGAATIGVLRVVRPTIFEGLIVETLRHISLLERFNSFGLGLVEVEHVVFYLSFTSIVLFVTVQLIEKRRWA